MHRNRGRVEHPTSTSSPRSPASPAEVRREWLALWSLPWNGGPLRGTARAEGGEAMSLARFVVAMAEHPAVKRLLERDLLEPVEQALRPHNVELEDVLGPSRTAEVVTARTSVWRALRDAGLTYQSIGVLFDRHHTTIIHALNQTRRERTSNRQRLLWRRKQANVAQLARTAMRVV